MDKSAIKTYAVETRRKLIEAVKLKARQLYIFEDSDEYIKREIDKTRINDVLRSDGIFLSSEQLQARDRLFGELLHEGSPYKPAIYNRVMENIACTWFNRLIALRIMEVNDWLPSSIRILSSREPGRVEPDAMREVERLDYVNQKKVAELRADTALNASEKLYKYILISQCNALSSIMPGMFQKEHDYTELLLPDALLAKGGIVNDLVSGIVEKNFKIRTPQDEADIKSGKLKEEDAPVGQIEIVGWLYQYYISEKKDEVFAGLKKNIKINKDTIPAATQLFTPEWIVKYMVENSLGRLWLESHSNEELRKNWKYYVDEAEQEPEVAEQLRVLRSQSPVKRPEDIKLIDPCMGSGHILVYAFEVLFQIYRSEGYSERDIPNLILLNNLYGLDIDDRAGQLAYFALMIKARSYSRRFFRQESIPQPMVYAIPETKIYIIGLKKWLGVSMNETERDICLEDLKYLAELFDKGKEYGSAMKIEREIDFTRLRKYVKDYSPGQMTIEEAEFIQQTEHLDILMDVAAVLLQKYDVVVTNPPYMGNMPAKLTDYVINNFPDSKYDLYSVFMERAIESLTLDGYVSMITQHAWMFISSFERLRNKLIHYKWVNLVHLGARAFEAIGGEVVQTVAFVLKKEKMKRYKASAFRLVDIDSAERKELAFLAGEGQSRFDVDNFDKLPGNPFAYWLTENYYTPFTTSQKIDFYVEKKAGVVTGNDPYFVRFWFEPCLTDVSFVGKKTYAKYHILQKGGGFRRYYGNNENVLKLLDLYDTSKTNVSVRRGDSDYYFRKSIGWSYVGSNLKSFRAIHNSVCGTATPTIYVKDDKYYGYILAFLNTKISYEYLSAFNPTINQQMTDVCNIPLVIKNAIIETVSAYTKINLSITNTDWDSFETSWDFQTHPLCNDERTIATAFTKWELETAGRFDTLQTNEEELNRIFIEIYGLKEELAPEVEDKDVTVRRADLSRDIRSFISYAVGCMFGRYSLDEPGLVFAGGKFDMNRYKVFMPEDDNIVPIGSADYFDDDIVVRFTEFVRTVYGDSTLGENLNFIADALYPNASGTAQERLRRYFLNDFYKDHVKIYQKRPIYWMLDSGKKDGFKALFYLHRYDKYTVARARTDFLHPLQRKYEAEIKRLEMLSESTDNAREKAAYRKEVDVLLTKIDECRAYDQVVSHIAHQQIDLDLDDGVKVNYDKFQGVKVPIDGGKSLTMDLLGRI